MYLNKVILIGNLTRDPELRSLPSGAAVVTMALATNRVWKDREGNKKEDTQYHNIVVFGKQAETSAQYLKKGQSILIEGRMQTRSWDDKSTGEKKYRTEIVADRVQFGPKSGSGSGESHSVKGVKTPEEAVPGGEIEYPEENVNPEDIPF
ncbi:MAG TPA: single-stranded DNA-binding protein [Candidatus Paceibacterota bacterium]